MPTRLWGLIHPPFSAPDARVEVRHRGAHSMLVRRAGKARSVAYRCLCLLYNQP